MNKFQKQIAFTLVETMLIMAIIGLLFSITSILLSKLIPRANLVSTTETLTAELKNQQLKAMTGEKNSADQSDHYGVHIEANQYTLFNGSSFDPNSPDNLVTQLISSIVLSSNLTNQNVIFSRGSGEILNFNAGANTITITDTLTGETRNISFNLYGIPE